MDFQTVATSTEVVFRLDDCAHAASGVRVWLDLEHHVEPPAMQRTDRGWTLSIARPPVQRLEYLLIIGHADGSESMGCDPGNASRVQTPFGEHSVIEFPGYQRPNWLEGPAVELDRTSLLVPARGLRAPVPITLCTPSELPPGTALPLVLLHDGPEFDALARASRFSAAMIASGVLPPHRLALLAPVDRNYWYAALPAYAAALRDSVLPALRREARVDGKPVIAGASLGALAALHVACTVPGLVDAAFLQSGSFFRHDVDSHESSFTGFESVASFVEGLEHAAPRQVLDIAMTCGLGEENLANNRIMAATLARAGHRVRLAEVPDAHTFTGWRDALDPNLVDLLRRVWS